MAYTEISISYNEGTLCEEISFTEEGEKEYELGSTITLSDSRLWRDRSLIIRTVNYMEDGMGGLHTTVSGFSQEYEYTRKAPNFDISLFSMTAREMAEYINEFPIPDSKVYMRYSDEFGIGGWTMHTIAEKLVAWMGLTIENNLPDYAMSDFSISVGSTYFESLVGLVSEFDPIIVLSGGILFILERNGAGVLMSGGVTLGGSERRSVDREYAPKPGCIKVEGGEGQDLDFYVTLSGRSIYVEGTVTDIESGSVSTSGVTDSTYVIESEAGETLSESNIATSISGIGWASSSSQTSTSEYDDNNVVKSDTQVCSAMIGGQQVVYCRITTTYEHDKDFNLTRQTTVKEELFVHNSEDGSYVKFDPRDHYLSAMAAHEETIMMPSEVRTVIYSKLNDETYSVSTTTANRMWNLENELWDVMYTTDQDIVESGGQQHITRTSSSTTPRTIPVFAGDCPDTPEGFAQLDEPPVIFRIPTPDWDAIEDCYTYLSALVGYEFQKVKSVSPIIDPLPLMSVNGLGSIIETGIYGFNYVRGYEITIHGISGNTVALDMEARRA